MFLTSILHFLSLNIILVLQCIIFLILNVLDAHSTWLVLKPNNYHRERNPIARWVFRKLRIPRAIIIFKAVLMSFLGFYIGYWWKEALTINLGLLIGNVLFIIVVLHNYKVSRHYRKQREYLEASKAEGNL